MRFIIGKQNLEKHLDNISRALVANSPFPVLTGVMITANESNIQLMASNGNLSIKEVVGFDSETKVMVAGKTLVNGKLFREIVKKQSGPIEIVVSNNTFEIKSNGARTVLSLLDINDYPTLNFDSVGKELIINFAQLNQIIKNVSFAAAENDKRIILNGVNLHARGGTLIATATNTFRLAQERVAISSGVEFNITILSKNLRDFFPSGASGELHIKVDDAKIVANYESSTIFSKLIDGVYPEVNNLIPKTYEFSLEIDSRLLIDLLERATVISEENSRVVRLLINDNELTVETKRSEVGEAVIKTSEFKSSGPHYEIAFNANFLRDALSRFNGMVMLGFTGQFKAFVVVGKSNPHLTQLILPHRSF